MVAYDIVVVGSGFYGSTIAERCASIGKRVLLIEKRPHIGGNSYSEFDEETGIEIHRYGAHMFHTKSAKVWNYVRRFSEFNAYRHHALTSYRGQIYQIPINLSTICQFFGRHFTPAEAARLIREQAAEMEGRTPTNLEEKAISLVGRPLYEAFIRGYSAKQWQTDPTMLPASIIERLPVRLTFDTRYFSDPYEGQPLQGYTAVFRRMLDSPLIDIRLNTDYFAIRSELPAEALTIFTGPIDRFFDYAAGELSWRTLDFEFERLDVADFQGISVMHYADECVPYTRIVEFKHLHPERNNKSASTIVAKEYSRFARQGDEPYYPIGTPDDRRIYANYAEMARSLPNVVFGGRLGTYRYLDMHQAIGSALAEFDNDILPRFDLRSARRHP